MWQCYFRPILFYNLLIINCYLQCDHLDGELTQDSYFIFPFLTVLTSWAIRSPFGELKKKNNNKDTRKPHGIFQRSDRQLRLAFRFSPKEFSCGSAMNSFKQKIFYFFRHLNTYMYVRMFVCVYVWNVVRSIFFYFYFFYRLFRFI